MFSFGPVVKWYNAAFALRRQEFDSPQVHNFGFLNVRASLGLGISIAPRVPNPIRIKGRFFREKESFEIAYTAIVGGCVCADIYRKRLNSISYDEKKPA